MASPVTIRTRVSRTRTRSTGAAGAHGPPYSSATSGTASTEVSATIGATTVTRSGIDRCTPADSASSLCSESREKPATETYRIAVPRMVCAQLDTLNASRKKPSAVAPVIRPMTANWMFRTTDSTPRLAASGTPKRISFRAITLSKPIRTGTLANANTSTPVTNAPPNCPQAKLNGPAPATASPMATIALTERPAALATVSLPCWNVRMRVPLRTAVRPSMTMVSASSRTTGAAARSPAAAENAGAVSQKRP